MLKPVVRLVTITPIASADAETTAIAASLCIFPFSAILRRKKAAIITTGIENFIGANPHATAIESAPNDT